MRTTIPLLQSTITTTATTATTTTLSTSLLTLKATHLQRIAQRTGIQSTGRKAVLTRRLATELPRCEYREYREYQRVACAGEPGPAQGMGEGERMSILSIDMGIRNLAFAHLLVAPPSPPPPLYTSRDLTQEDAGDRHRPRITLAAWRRLNVFALDHDHPVLTPTPSPSSNEPELAPEPSTLDTVTVDAATPPAPASELEEEDQGTYSPAHYADKAYTLLTTLLARYRPTHVLIERQRFRSGGAAAVQEWTIRVGVFEGMLYAVLEALRRERGSGSVVPVPVPVPRVWGVEPGRVSRFWAGRITHTHGVDGGEGDVHGNGHGEGEGGGGGLLDCAMQASGDGFGAGGEPSSPGVEVKGNGTGNRNGNEKRKKGTSKMKVQQQQQQQHPQTQTQADANPDAAAEATAARTDRKKKSTREVKKMKMDLVGHWLQTAAITTTTTTSPHPKTLALADDQELHRWVEAYRTKWQAPRKAKAKAGAGANRPEIGKLDDLADCLVQGVTWLEWQHMRRRLVADPSLLEKI